MPRSFEVVSVNLSTEKGTVKRPVGEAVIGPDGVLGDAHAGQGCREVSLLGEESLRRFTAETGRVVAAWQ